jgi:hypothetical protein
MEDGERGRNRTYNLLIKSQLLCQLSYAPTVGDRTGGTICDCSISADTRSLVTHERTDSLTCESVGQCLHEQASRGVR